jgi:protein-S-isoprenylcysteine O-methyltransferase Ste14
VGSGDRIALVTLPFAAAGVLVNVRDPEVFDVGGPPTALAVLAVLLLLPGVTAWIWSAVLILRHVPRHELITAGPFAVVVHPLYTAVALLVLPSAGILLDTWLGVPLGLVLYVASRVYAPAEEAALSREFGERWDRYRASVTVPWL